MGILDTVKFDRALSQYQRIFDDTPTTANLPQTLYDKAADVLSQAVQNKTPLSDDEFFRSVGLEPPPEDDLI